jgi:dipeptidyl aminopeptidase/acylaminoacyl peptidase
VERISLDSSSAALEAFDAATPQLSADGNVAAFLATRPPSSGTSSPVQLLVRDLGASTTTVASVTPQGQPTTRPVNNIDLSADGKIVAFTTDLYQGTIPDTESGVLRRDLVAGRTIQVAVRFTGSVTTDLGTSSRYWLLGMSRDASRVVMLSRGSWLVSNANLERNVPVVWTELSAR